MGAKTATEAEECDNVAMTPNEVLHQTNTVGKSR